ncbi:hypothetical protein [Streptomyces sp. NPDC048565]|uniref:hypothetical protein n=1 Tax=Streptomyces sp. NPDC048565 TaxID=3155266 RepID=UPI003431E684
MDVTGDLTTVGVAGASALVASMTVDGWHGCRQWIAQWFGRGGSGTEARTLTRLDRDRESLLAAPEDEAEDRAREVSASWAVRLQDAADEDPSAAGELLEFVSRWRAEHPEAAQKETVIRQNAKASGKARVNQVGGNQTVFHARRT